MLTEDQVVDITCLWLERQGWKIKSRCYGTAKGDDILATSINDETLAVECKGAMSPNTMQSFHSNYLWKSISGALFNTVRNVENKALVRMEAIALPDTNEFRALTSTLQGFIERNHIFLFWVGPTGIVEVWQPYKLFKADV
ncbi:hypothetical protein [Rheinheimera sp.]|uniref:hypothetical protein n=1 Tax=Rheinheimera sp. TaxID=1869214 RepID=UPI00307D7B3D